MFPGRWRSKLATREWSRAAPGPGVLQKQEQKEAEIANLRHRLKQMQMDMQEDFLRLLHAEVFSNSHACKHLCRRWAPKADQITPGVEDWFVEVSTEPLEMWQERLLMMFKMSFSLHTFS